MSLTDDIFAKRGTWQLFNAVGGQDLSSANIGHIDRRGRLWLRLPRALLCTDGRHVIKHCVQPFLGDRRVPMEGFSRNDKFWIITEDHRLISLALDDDSVVDHSQGLPSLRDARWLSASSHEEVLIALPGTLLRYDGTQVTALNIPEDHYGMLRSATISPDGDLWLTNDRGLYLVENGNLQKVEFPGGKESPFWDTTAGRDKTFWGPVGGVVMRLHGGQADQIIPEGFGESQSFTSLMVDDEDNFWFSIHFRGTMCVNSTGSVFFPFEDTPGLSWPKCIVQDETGAFWFIGVGNGILRYDPRTLNVAQRGYMEASALEKGGRLLLTAASKGLLEYDATRVTQLCPNIPARCFRLALWKDDVYLASSNGLSVFDTSRGQLVGASDIPDAPGELSKAVHYMAEDYDGCLWLSATDVMCRWMPSGFKTYPKSELGLGGRVFIYADSAGKVWFIGGAHAPILTFGPEGFSTFPDRLGELFGAADMRVTSCCETPEGDLLVGFSMGKIARFIIAEGTIELEMELRGGVRHIRIDADGAKWISTSDGLYRVGKDVSYRMTEESLLPSRRIVATHQLEDGRILIVTERGVCEYRPTMNVRPEVFVSRVIADRVYLAPREPVVFAARSVVSVYLTAVNMKSGPLGYQVRLVGHDDEWTETEQEEFHFEGLPMGTYRFEAKAVDQDLVTSRETATVEVHIIPDTNETQIAELENELRDAEDFAANIIRSINDAIVVLNADGTIVTANYAALNLLRHDHAELIGKPVGILFSKTNESLFNAQGLENLKMNGQFRARELELLDCEGGRLPVILTASCMHDRTGKFQGFVLAASDIAEYKELQTQVLQSQKMESLGLLASGVAHDFKNLLSIMIGNADLVRSELNADSEDYECLSDIVAAGGRANMLCTELLSYSGKREHSLTPFDLSTMVRENANLLRTSTSRLIAIESELDDDLPHILGDEVQIMQIVLNLVINAADAIGDKSGKISLSTTLKDVISDELKSEFCATPPDSGKYVVFEVSDTGCGMTEETRMRIFEPFFTTKATGRGLGLAAIHGIIKSHGGAIKVHSVFGEGTTFEVFLPVVAGQPD